MSYGVIGERRHPAGPGALGRSNAFVLAVHYTTKPRSRDEQQDGGPENSVDQIVEPGIPAPPAERFQIVPHV